jgi:hypothetical protein
MTPQLRARSKRWTAIAPVAAALALMSLAACSGDDAESVFGEAAPERPGRIAVTPYVADEFMRAVVREQENGDRHIVKWPMGAEVRVDVEGAPTEDDLAVLDSAIASLGAAVPVSVQRVDGDANVVVHFIPKTEWAATVDDPAIDLDASGWTYTHSEGSDERPRVAGDLTDATILVDSDIAQAPRNQVIAHEMGHALGLGHSTCAASLMYDGDGGRPLWSPTPLDTDLLRVLYHPAVEAGMKPAEIDKVLDRSGRVGAVCGVVDWQLVSHDGVAYYCRVGPGAQPCTAYAGAAEPAAPISEPDGYLVGGAFSQYDPALWQSFEVSGMRLLCERVGDTYRPCIVLDGSETPAYPVTEPDYWTDGEYVYDDYPG